MADLDELSAEFYKDLIEAEAPAEVPAPEPEPKEEVQQEIPAPEPEQPVVETAEPEYKAKKFIEIENEKDVYNKLKAKFQHEEYSDEEKAMAYIRSKNPGLDENEIAFIAESEYGIGTEPVDEADLTDEQVKELRKQAISKKKLLREADEYFTSQAESVTIDGYDPLELDPDYKTFRTASAEQRAKQQQQQELYAKTAKEIDNSSKTITEITKSISTTIDDSKFAIDVKFVMDEGKQKQLSDFAKSYIPTEAEVAKFTNPDGKFDFKGYMVSLAPRVFAEEIMEAGIKQAMTTDREKFIERELKNSTLRNNDVSKIADSEFDFVEAWQFGR